MINHIKKSIVCSLLVLLANIGCSVIESDARAASNSPSKFIIKAKSVGEYKIGESTLESILGTDTPENRKRFAASGLNFEFNKGKELTGVTVTVNKYALENGLTVGSSASEVVKQLGEPHEKRKSN